MKLARGAGKLFGSMVFTTFLVLAILTMEMVSFTSLDNVKAITGGLLEDQLFSTIDEESLEDLHSLLIFQCSQASAVAVPFIGGQQVTLGCEQVRNSKTSELPSLITSALVDNLYYKDFSCSFTDCITSSDPQNLLILVSNEGNMFYKTMQSYMWVATGAGLLLLLVSVETWPGRLKGIGFNLVFTGLPFLLLGYIQPYLIPSLGSEIESSVMPIVDSLVSSLKEKFVMVLVAGVVLVVAGYALSFYISRKSKKK